MSQSRTQPSRRGFMLGTAAVSAAAAAVATLPRTEPETPSAPASEKPPAPDNGGGYRLSEHVKRYYQTTRV
jgi:hypothetical protein